MLLCSYYLCTFCRFVGSHHPEAGAVRPLPDLQREPVPADPRAEQQLRRCRRHRLRRVIAAAAAADHDGQTADGQPGRRQEHVRGRGGDLQQRPRITPVMKLKRNPTKHFTTRKPKNMSINVSDLRSIDGFLKWKMYDQET